MAQYSEQYIYYIFRDYYHIGGNDKQDAALSEPERRLKRREELRKGHTEPSHSLFGVVGHICMETGWSVNYVLDKINVVQLSMMMADIPHYEEGRKMTPEELMKEMERRDKERNNQQGKKKPRKGVDPLTFFRDYAVKD